MTGQQRPKDISTKLQRIATQSRMHPQRVWTTLAHHIDMDFLKEAWRRIRKDGAVGVDGRDAAEYAKDLDENLRLLADRFHKGTYRAPPVRRVHIPKGNGKTRPLGIPTVEDKVLQKAVTMLLEAVYEQDFLDCSYGFRPNRSQHQALQELRTGLMQMKGGYVLDLDLASFFDTLDHKVLRSFLDERIRDGVLRRAIDKWLKAGVMEDGSVHRSRVGSPQGGVISPLLANIYLHHVLDLWFEHDVKPRMHGRAFMVRFADDAELVLKLKEDALRVLEVLPKRLGRFGLRLNDEKTRLVRFSRPPHKARDGQPRPETFNFLGFTHYWGRSRKGNSVIKRKTAKDRLSRAIQNADEWCKINRHLPIGVQWRALSRKLRGHYAYYGITDNIRALQGYYQGVLRRWQYWLARRSQRGHTWKWFARIIVRYPLPRPRIVHSYVAKL